MRSTSGLAVEVDAADASIVSAVAGAAPRAERLVSVCTGALVLAATGLLDGRRATTHWSACAGLAEAHPDVDVDPDAIFVRDGDIWTSVGVTAGMDLALALVTDDHGPDLAHAVVGWLVMFVQRAGSDGSHHPRHLSPPLRRAQAPVTPQQRRYPQPPFDAGSPSKAPAALVELVRRRPDPVPPR